MNPPFLDPDDPRLTAYALGEADESDRRAVEAFLAESAEGRAEVGHTQKMAQALAAEYAREHSAYLAARTEGELPSNVVPFAPAHDRSWQRATIVVLKVAAVLAFTAPLVYLSLRRTHRPETTPLASAPQRELDRAATPPIGADEPFAKDEARALLNEEKSTPTQASASSVTKPDSVAMAPAAPTSSVLDGSLAMEPAADSDKMAESAAGGRASEAFPKMEAAPPAATRSALKSVPGASSASSAAAPASRPAKPLSSSERVARSMVRIRAATGEFFSGVLVSSEGLILAVTPLAESTLQRPCTVFLADQRELPAFAKRAGTNPGWYWLLIDAKELPAVTLAKDVPTGDAPLAVASTDPMTGTLTVAQVRAGDASSARRADRERSKISAQTVGGTTLAFDAAGELLVIEQTLPMPTAADKATTRDNSLESKRLRVRSFTETERAMLRRTTTRTRQE